MRATAKDLRFHSSEIIETASRGEEVIITFRGKPCVRIVPVGTKAKRGPANHSLFGIWKDNDTVKDVRTYVREIRKGRSS